MKTDTQRINTELRVRALSRWEGEGGVLAPGATESIDESELRILARLGAALLDQWSELSPPLQQSIPHRAMTLDRPEGHAIVKDRLARLLRENDS